MRTRPGSVSPLASCFLLAAALSLFAGPAAASPFGTSYTASVTNMPGTDTAVLEFDGLEETLGSSGLVVGENSTPFLGFELIEFSLRTADGNPFVGQQVAAAAIASVRVTDLHWFGDPNPAQALPNSAFLWLTIDGEAQALSDFLGLGLFIAAHPLDASIPVLVLGNDPSDGFAFDTLGGSAHQAFAALVGPTLAAQIDDIHFGVSAVPIPEPATGLLVLFGVLCFARHARASRR
jgi:hypothetical protein